MIDIKVVNKKLVKPCIPTPQNLKHYKFSFTDEISSTAEFGVLLFYASREKQVDLEESLAKILVEFYPLAGRFIMNDHCVDCSDQGVEFVEAKAPDVELASLISERNLENLDGLLPRKNHQVDVAVNPLLSIQITELNCGGLVIGISLSHKIFDGSSLGTFVAAWSNASNPRPGPGPWPGKLAANPSLDSWSMFPANNQNTYLFSEIEQSAQTPRTVRKRFIFNNEAITSLRSKLRPKEGKLGVSKVRVVSALIAKALIGVNRVKNGEVSRACMIIQMINIRERTIPPLPKHSCGNLAFPALTGFLDASEMGIQELADLMGDAIDKFIVECAEILSLDVDGLNKIMFEPQMNAFKALQSGEANLILFTDWSKFGFYEADFGWGKPVWTSTSSSSAENMVVLMENKEGNGIEAWVCLNKNDMPLFEQEEEIRLFAT